MNLKATALLVIGGARSGKSAYAQTILAGSARLPVVIVTGEAKDAEMAARISAHRAARPPDWMTIEEPLDLVGALDRSRDPGCLVLVDCLTLWLSNLYMTGQRIEAECESLREALARPQGPVILVSNEVGGGIVPDTALARDFRDAQGRLNQSIAAVCSHVVLVTAGLPMLLKPAAPLSIDL